MRRVVVCRKSKTSARSLDCASILLCKIDASLGMTGCGSLVEADYRVSSKFYGQATKGAWWMPWQKQAMKDVASCDKPRGAASRHSSDDFRMGKPTEVKPLYAPMNP